MEMNCHRYDVTDVDLFNLYHAKTSYKLSGMKMIEFLKLKAMHHNIIIIQVLDRVYNRVFNIFQVYQYFTIYRLYFLLKLEKIS